MESLPHRHTLRSRTPLWKTQTVTNPAEESGSKLRRIREQRLVFGVNFSEALGVTRGFRETELKAKVKVGRTGSGGLLRPCPRGLKRRRGASKCGLTLLRICPEVDTLRMSFCGDPGSCSGSLSDDSSGPRAAADSGPPASAILPSDPGLDQSRQRPPAADPRQRRGALV